MFCYYNKQSVSVLGLVLYELDANKKCQVSLVVKYIYIVMRKPGFAICEQQRCSSDSMPFQPAHQSSLISTYVICCLDSIRS